MTQEITVTSPIGSTPYITTAEYRQAPTSVDVDDFVGGGSMALNNVELLNVIARASSWMDAHCGQVLAATQDTEAFRARVSRDGFLKVHPRYHPVIGVVAASYGSNPTLMNTLDPTTAWIEEMAVVFPLSGISASFLGQIQFSRVYSPLAEQFVQMTYVNGYANSLTTVTTDAGATSLAVSELCGFQPGTHFTVFDGVETEMLEVAGSFVPTVGTGVLPLTNPTMYAHNVGMSASAFPPAIKQAAIYMTNVILKSRGNSAVAMTPLTPSQIIGNNPNVANDYSMACDLLEPFRRIR